MAEMILPVRRYNVDPSMTLTLDPSHTALMLIDCDGARDDARLGVIRSAIAPTLRAARQIGLRVVYVHDSAYGTGGPHDVTRSLVDVEEVPPADRPHWKPKQPTYDPSIAPRPDEPELPKSRQSGFEGTHVDYYLKTWGVDTIVTVGFWLKCCLFLTCIEARWRNYRVIMLRDCTCPPQASEYPDTLDPNNEQGGWMRFVFIRMFETLIGYTSTAGEFAAACRDVSR